MLLIFRPRLALPLLTFLLWDSIAFAKVHAVHGNTDGFVYDPPDQSITSTLLDGENSYDCDIVIRNDQLWLTWLEFVPGEGDCLCVGTRKNDKWVGKTRVTQLAGKYAKPTLTKNSFNGLWLSYERMDPKKQQWDVFVQEVFEDLSFGPTAKISEGRTNNINHSIAAATKGGAWFVWQADCGGQFDIQARRAEGLADGIVLGNTQTVSSSRWGDWRPDVAVTSNSNVCVVWDAYDGDSFNVLARWLVKGVWRDTVVVADGPEFQARAKLASTDKDRVWATWEEGGVNWGKTYRSDTKFWNKASDKKGPLHRMRKLSVAVLTADGMSRPAKSLPMQSFEQGVNRPKGRDDARQLGVFYERPEITVDEQHRPWIVYRHFYRPQVGQKGAIVHHKERGWRLYALRYDGQEWSKLYAFDALQRDGMQRLSVTPTSDGIAAAWSTGRTDRRKAPNPRGIATAFVHSESQTSPLHLAPVAPMKVAVSKKRTDSPPSAVTLNDTKYSLTFGDLHRHTDLSLCFAFYDGSIQDAYRYAIDVADLDFLGITDHTRDISHGDVLSQLWWRSVKSVTRHRLAGSFFPYFGYERSHNNTDHNVISLKDNVLRNFPPPLPEFWKELAENTITIPHNPVSGDVWNYQNDKLRPLIEIYQGYRDTSVYEDANKGLEKGYHMGFIASSDHLSTNASFACVWTPEVTRESIFRSMQARRTYAATDKIRLIFRCGEHWMGERIAISGNPKFLVEIEGTDEIEWVDLYRNGKRIMHISAPRSTKSFKKTFSSDVDAKGEQYFFVHVMQRDGNQAWSSPIWVVKDNGL
ncbi:hypothetical protein ACFL1X_01005 [Candidatus Hydrogenedentota bacterium]